MSTQELFEEQKKTANSYQTIHQTSEESSESTNRSLPRPSLDITGALIAFSTLCVLCAHTIAVFALWEGVGPLAAFGVTIGVVALVTIQVNYGDW